MGVTRGFMKFEILGHILQFFLALGSKTVGKLCNLRGDSGSSLQIAFDNDIVFIVLRSA